MEMKKKEREYHKTELLKEAGGVIPLGRIPSSQQHSKLVVLQVKMI